jgi:Holliday junction DNA helicase RuvA
VGYEVRVPYSTSQLPPVGEDQAFIIRTHVREDAITLYGFRTGAEREIFEQLNSVKNVGPKMALMMLAALHAYDIVKAVRRKDANALIVPGIGPKTAERIVSELHDEIEKRHSMETEEEEELGGSAEEAVSALENMGANSKLAKQAVESVLKTKPDLDDFDEIMRGALRWLREKK